MSTWAAGRRGSAGHKVAVQRMRDSADAAVLSAMTEPSKAELQSMLAEAARNTAAQQTNRESRDGEA